MGKYIWQLKTIHLIDVVIEIPQGNNVEPVLFLIYINDLHNFTISMNVTDINDDIFWS